MSGGLTSGEDEDGLILKLEWIAGAYPSPPTRAPSATGLGRCSGAAGESRQKK